MHDYDPSDIHWYGNKLVVIDIFSKYGSTVPSKNKYAYTTTYAFLKVYLTSKRKNQAYRNKWCQGIRDTPKKV